MRQLETRLVQLILAAMLLLAPLAAQAVNPDEMLQDPVLEERARDLSAIIRCMKCQNQSIDDSDADLARDLRILVRERIVAGDSDREVLDFLVDRYGDFVLLKPQFSTRNLLLWLLPALALVFGGWITLRTLGRGKPLATETAGSAGLTEEEQAALRKILDEDGRGRS